MRPRAQAFTAVETPQELTMAPHTELPHSGATASLAGWRLPRALAIGGALTAGLIGAALGTAQSGSIGRTVAPELPSIGTINTTMISTSAMQSVRVAAAAAAADTQASFAFGFLEFDWDPDAPGGVPGFDSWPNRKLRIAEAHAQPATHGISK
jgi:hypothetical protein